MTSVTQDSMERIAADQTAMEIELKRLREDNARMLLQIGNLASYLSTEWLDEIGRGNPLTGESAVEVAIRLLCNSKDREATLCRRLEESQRRCGEAVKRVEELMREHLPACSEAPTTAECDAIAGLAEIVWRYTAEDISTDDPDPGKVLRAVADLATEHDGLADALRALQIEPFAPDRENKIREHNQRMERMRRDAERADEVRRSAEGLARQRAAEIHDLRTKLAALGDALAEALAQRIEATAGRHPSLPDSVAPQPEPSGDRGMEVWPVVLQDVRARSRGSMSYREEVVLNLVLLDMRARDGLGRALYGTPLRTHNGRRAIIALCEMITGMIVHVRGEIADTEECPDCEHDVMEHEPRRGMECSRCACGHGTYRNSYQRES